MRSHHLEHHDVTLVVVSRAPLPEIEAFKKRERVTPMKAEKVHPTTPPIKHPASSRDDSGPKNENAEEGAHEGCAGTLQVPQKFDRQLAGVGLISFLWEVGQAGVRPQTARDLGCR